MLCYFADFLYCSAWSYFCLFIPLFDSLFVCLFLSLFVNYFASMDSLSLLTGESSLIPIIIIYWMSMKSFSIFIVYSLVTTYMKMVETSWTFRMIALIIENGLSIYRISIMCHRAKILQGRTFRNKISFNYLLNVIYIMKWVNSYRKYYI